MTLTTNKSAEASKPLRVFISGASSGIGLALAKQYAQNGVVLGLAARRSELLQNFKADIAKAGIFCACEIYELDVRDHSALNQAAQDFIAKHGGVEIVIANAGVSCGTLTEHAEDIAAFQAVMDTNVMGMVHTFQPFIASMQQAKQGQLVGIASVAGIRGLPGAGAYSASKAAAINYLESLRVEMQNHGIVVNTIAPGYIRTPMTDINDYRMPFLMEVDVAAHKFVQAIANKRRFVIIPWQMAVVAKLMRLIPPFLWDFLAKNAPHKSRGNIKS
jgi:short-subunit dehydrogenase